MNSLSLFFVSFLKINENPMNALKKLFVFIIVLSAFFTAQAQIKIMCIGNSVTQGTLDTNYLKPYNYTVLKSWRYPFWLSLDSVGVKFVMEGSQKKLNMQGSKGAGYLKSKYTTHVFDSTHEAHWGASSDSIVKMISGLKNTDTADIVLMHIGGTDGDTGAVKTMTNIDSIVTLMRQKNPYTIFFLAKVVVGGTVNDSIASLAAKRNKTISPVNVVDLFTGWDTAAMALDTIVPDSAGEKVIGRKFFNVLMSKDAATTLAAPTNLKQGTRTIHTIGLTWNTTITPALDIFSGYNIFVDGKKMNEYLVKETSFLIQNLDIVTSYNVKVVAVDNKNGTSMSSSTVAMTTAGYTVKFKVKNGTTPVQNANVAFNSANIKTDANGEALFLDVPPGFRTYTVTKTGYVDVVMANQNMQSDSIFNVNLKGIGLQEEQDLVEVYPNPAGDFIVVTRSANCRAELYDVNGKILEKVTLGSNESRIDVSAFCEGVYMIKVLKNEKEIVKKFTIKR